MNGSLQKRIRWREDEDIGSYRQFIALEIPEVAQKYFKYASHVDMHSRCRQSDRDMEKIIQIKE